MTQKRRLSLLGIILVISAILRFFNLMHDSPYFFNPDERNMANAVSQFRLPARLSEIPNCILSQLTNCNLNPHFFAYGQFPLYLAFASDQISSVMLNSFQHLMGIPKPASQRGEQVRDDNGAQPTTNNQPASPSSPRVEADQGGLITSFPSAIFWLRFWSAVSSVLIVLLVYLISNVMLNSFQHLKQIPKQVRDDNNIIGNWKLEIGHYAALIAAFSPGLIQSAHFGTTESFLTFFFLLSVYVSLRYLSNLGNLKFVFLASLTIGLAMGSKLTGIFFFVPPAVCLIIRIIELLGKGKNKFRIGLPARIAMQSVAGGFIIVGSIAVFALSSPYNLVDPGDFQSAVFGYESDVAMGRYEAFYTRQFVNTTPIIFQAEKIFPYTLGWPVFILGSIGILFTTLKLFLCLILFIIQKVQSSKFKVQKLRIKKCLDFDNLDFIGILILGFWIYFIPNAFLFAKWTRFMTPILPFFVVFAAYTVNSFYNFFIDRRVKFQISNFKFQINIYNLKIKKLNNSFVYLFICLFIITSILPGLMFMSIYTHDDSRLQASYWIYKNIPANAYILSETANVVDIPLGLPTTNHKPPTNNYTVISFDFYHIDENPSLGLNALLANLERADYAFIPSRRIFANYTRLPQIYPLVTKYYQLLNSGALGFVKIAEINSYPAIGPIKFPDEQAEETFTVFDHPVIRIYKKTKPYTTDQYRLLLNESA